MDIAPFVLGGVIAGVIACATSNLIDLALFDWWPERQRRKALKKRQARPHGADGKFMKRKTDGADQG